ncbi:DUF898 family protein [Spirochaeta isovalerica]|uniref:Uncharacterized membrane protein YjgN (DUF898 family) n=1 Tax=Spirochaeta isovalerica TaxID=150 RepID=A0A841RHF1_9SPIO|nr:DUF898 family protein [Spirochaeta isovalerica]MBB6482440.1 uncharacterized membrane protein YjgN (DUF898 family) [Spirochaeta isovalerica]
MIEKFVCRIDGKELFKKAIVYLLSYLVCIFGLFQMAFHEIWAGYALMFILLFIASVALQYQYLSSFIPAVSLDGKPFDFSGTFGGYMKMNLKGILLSAITLGIYSPWYSAEYNRFVADNSSYPEKTIAFNGKGGKLFVYMLVGFFLPLVVVIAIVTPLYISAIKGNSGALVLAGVVYFVGVFLISSLLVVLEYKWMMDYSFGNDDIKLTVSTPRAMFFIFGQILLGMITMGLYLFAAEVKIFAYIAERTVLSDTLSGKTRKVRFTGATVEGFSLFLGQTLLSLITLGLYMPVAYAKTTNWLISHLEIADEAV